MAASNPHLEQRRLLPWGYSVLLHACIVAFLLLNFHWSSSDVASMGGHGDVVEPVKATVVDQSLVDQQMAMLKSEQDKKRQEKQQLEQNITDLRQQQISAQEKLNKQVTDLQKQAQDEQDRVAKLKAEDAAIAQRQKSADNAQRHRQLQQEIADEEKAQDAQMTSLLAQWKGLMIAKIHNNWTPPPNTPDNLSCIVMVTQVTGGTVTNAQVPTCNGDDAVVQSIITAVYKASPLPAPPDPSLFDQGRNLKLTFDNKGH